MHVLPTLLAAITGHPRERHEVVWSSSIVCNIFRVWEMVFWRRAGIRPEQFVDEYGNVYSYTWENLLATYEGMARAWFAGCLPAFKIVRIPQLQLAGLAQCGIQPFAFAIAYDVATFGTQGQASAATWTHVVTGSNPNFLLSINQGGTGSDRSTAASYNVAALSKAVFGAAGTSLAAALWYLGNPATGSHTASVTFSAGDSNRSGSASYSGCASAIDNSGTANSNGGSSPLNLSITSVADNCWMTMNATAGDATMAAGASTTLRAHPDDYGIWVDGNAAITPAGSSTLQVTWSGTNHVIIVGATLAPAVAAVATPRLRSLLGVGL